MLYTFGEKTNTSTNGSKVVAVFWVRVTAKPPYLVSLNPRQYRSALELGRTARREKPHNRALI
jgi:hypothetical protein